MSDDDFYYPRKPHASIVRRQTMNLEQRAASHTYEDHMHTRDGTIPDERTAVGLAWHRTVLGLSNGRTVHRLVKELLDKGDLVRLGDGRLTMPEVQKVRAVRARKRAKPGGGEGESGGGQAPAVRQFQLLEGGRSPQAGGDDPVDERGTARRLAEVLRKRRANDGQTVRNLPMKSRGGAPSCRDRDTHEVAVVMTGFPARARPTARGDPPSARA